MGNKVLAFIFFILLLVVSISSIHSSSEYQNFISREGRNWKIQFKDGLAESLYGTGIRSARTPELAAHQFLRDFHSIFGIEPLSSIRLTKSEHIAAGTHFLYQQYSGGFPVVGGQIRLHFDNRNRLIAANSDYRKLSGAVTFPSDSSAAIQTIKNTFGKESRITNRGRWIYPAGKNPKPVWRFDVESSELTEGSWLVYIDASEPNIILSAKKTFMNFEGEGNVWLENPVITPTRQIQSFANMDATQALSGKFVKVLNANAKFDARLPLKLSDYTTAKEADRTYHYDEKDLRLAEAMAYFQINRVHDQWASFGFRAMDAPVPVIVNITNVDGGAGWDNAQYQRNSRYPKTGILTFGSGNAFENISLDGEIYYHEYGHAVLDRSNPALLNSFESTYPASFHEAFSDISAAAISGNSKFADFGFRLKSTKKFQGRNMNNQKKFPKDVVWPPAQFSEPHYTCLIMTGAWWDLQRRIGRLEAQRILYNSIRMLSETMNYFDVKESMLAADRSLNNGANATAIEQSFALHGLGGNDPGQKGPFSVSGLLTAGLPTSSDYVLKSSFIKGELITVILEYNATNLSPGYWFVPVKFDVNGPGGATPRSQFLVREVFNGQHQNLNGLYMAELHTDSSLPSGTYTIMVQGRVGGTTKILPEQTVTFTLN